MSKYFIASLVVIGVALYYIISNKDKDQDKDKDTNKDIDKQKNIIYRDKLTDEEMSNDKFKIQYEVRGISNDNDNLPMILKTIEQVITKVERIITKSNKHNYTMKDMKYINERIVKDIYLIITISDDNIKEEDGSDSKNTVGGSTIKVIDNSDNLPVVAAIQLTKEEALSNIKYNNGFNRLYHVFLHEVFHTLGVGFLWTLPDYNKNILKKDYKRYWIDNIEINPVYIGPSLDKYDGLSATVYHYSKFIGIGTNSGKLKSMPIEDNGNGGSKLWHWEQGDYTDMNDVVISKDSRMIDGIKVPGLDNEIMTAWGTYKQPLISTVTIANLEDLGYTVNYDEADIDKFIGLNVHNVHKEVKDDTNDIVNDVNTVKEEMVTDTNYMRVFIIGFIIIICMLIYYFGLYMN